MNAADIIAAVQSGELDSMLNRIGGAVTARRNVIAPAPAPIAPGEIVRFTATIRPSYMAGLRAEVIKVNDKTVRCRVVPEDARFARRFGIGEFRCPLVLIERA